MALDLRKQIRPNFLGSTTLQFILQNLANKSGDVQTNLLYFFTSSEVKQYHEALFLSYRPRTDHNFAIQIVLIQHSGRSKHAWAFTETVKKISKINHLYGLPVLTFDKRQSRLFKSRLIELYVLT